jgi:hypothetical protein
MHFFTDGSGTLPRGSVYVVVRGKIAGGIRGKATA